MTKVESGDALIARWTSWLDDLRRDIYFIHHHREMWQAVSASLVERAQGLPDTWLMHYQRLYVDGQAMALRRLIRSGGPDTITLTRVMENIIQNRQELTMEKFIERWSRHTDDPLVIDRGRREYESEWSDGTGQLDVAKVRRDKAAMNQIAQAVVDFADHGVAHVVKGRPHFPLTFGELDRAIDGVAETFQSYASLVTNSFYMLTPVVQQDWMSIFYRPIFDAPEWWSPSNPR